MEKTILDKELKKSFNFFKNEANLDFKSEGYGLIKDKTTLDNVSSIASVGFGLSALVIGVERKWISSKYAQQRVNFTLDTFIKNMESTNGFFYHFVDINSAKRIWDCEISIIDTAIFICGALLCGEYFGGQIKEKAERLYKNINWQWYTDKNKNQFYMSYTKEKGFFGYWDMYGEQLMLYVLGAGSPTYPIDKSMYYSLNLKRMDYMKIKDIIYTYCGTLFTYQYSHAWLDFRDLRDKNGVDWYENSIKATKANREYCINNSSKFKTFGSNSWGLTACVGINGYSGEYGAMPALSELDKHNDGTIPPCGAIGSIVFMSELVIQTMENFYNNYPKLWGRYGFKDAYNLDVKKQWYAKEYIGINKGISMVMIENYLTGLIWKYFMKNKYIQNGLKILEFKKQNN